MQVCMKVGLVLYLFSAVPTILANSQRTYNFFKDATSLAQAWVKAVRNFSESFNLHDINPLDGRITVEGFDDPLMAEAYDKALKSVKSAMAAISVFKSTTTKYAQAFRDKLFDVGTEIEGKFNTLVQKLNAHPGVVKEVCTKLYRGNITNAAAELTKDIKACADLSKTNSDCPEEMASLSTFMSLLVAAIDMNAKPIPRPLQCKLDVLAIVRSKYTELEQLVEDCLLEN